MNWEKTAYALVPVLLCANLLAFGGPPTATQKPVPSEATEPSGVSSAQRQTEGFRACPEDTLDILISFYEPAQADWKLYLVGGPSTPIAQGGSSQYPPGVVSMSFTECLESDKCYRFVIDSEQSTMPGFVKLWLNGTCVCVKEYPQDGWSTRVGSGCALGACCLGVDCIATNTSYECLTSGGDWYEGQSCPDFQCPPPTGACCANGVCLATNTESECLGLGGQWHIDQTCPEYQCPCPENTLEICLLTNSQPQETFWELYKHADGSLVAWNEVLELADHEYNWRICTEATTCYDLYIYDTAGDGNYPGYVTVTLNGSVIYDNPQFDYTVERVMFGQACPAGACCVANECVATVGQLECINQAGQWYEGLSCDAFACPTACPQDTLFLEILTDAYPEQTTWELIDDDTGMVVASGGPYAEPFTLYYEQVCIDSDGSYTLIVYDSGQDGLCCDNGDGHCYVYWNGVLIAQITQFANSSTLTVRCVGPPHPRGACCIMEPHIYHCVATTIELVCNVHGGQWYPGEDCHGDPPFVCPPPTGACCVAGVCYATVDQAVCETILHGSWFQDGVCETGYVCPPASCPPMDTLVVAIETDDSPEETTWELYEQGLADPVASGGPCAATNAEHLWEICLEPTKCYDFYIYDAGSNGITGAFGGGYWALFLNDPMNPVAYNDAFTGAEDGATVGNGCMPTGACCVGPDCVATEPEADCLARGGDWYEGSDCTQHHCPWYEFEVTAPYTSPLRTTYDSYDDCDLSDTIDHVYKVTIPYEADWSINTCIHEPDSGFDTILYVGSTFCSQDLAYDDNGCSVTKSGLIVHLAAGEVYVAVEGHAGFGEYILDICEVAHFEVPCPTGGVSENEACGADLNGGCDSANPRFEAVTCNKIVCGSLWANLGDRDSDWFEYIATNDTVMTWTVEAEMPVVTGLAEQVVPGVAGCDNLTGLLSPTAQAEPGVPATIELPVVAGGIYYLVVTPVDDSGYPCWISNDYVARLTGDCFCGDLDQDGDVDESDFWMFMNAFGKCAGQPGFLAAADFDGDNCITAVDYQTWIRCFRAAVDSINVVNDCPEDLDGDGTVNLADFAVILANYKKTGMGPDDGDFDGDGEVSLTDLAQFLSVYGQNCPTH